MSDRRVLPSSLDRHIRTVNSTGGGDSPSFIPAVRTRYTVDLTGSSSVQCTQGYAIQIFDDDDSDVGMTQSGLITRPTSPTPPHDPVDAMEEHVSSDSDDSVATLPAILPSREVHSNVVDSRFRNGPIEFPFVTHDSYACSNSAFRTSFTIKPRDTVEIGGQNLQYAESRDGDFLRIHDIIEDTRTEQFFLRGWRLRRTSRSNGNLTPSLNELYMALEVEEDDPRPQLTQGMITISVGEAYRRRRVIMTNSREGHTYRAHTRLDPDAAGYNEAKWSVFCTSELVCRWASVKTFKNAPRGSRYERRPVAEDLRRLRQQEADTGYSVPERVLQTDWLGFIPISKSVYTFADGYSGAGGASMAALLAGLNPDWSFDQDEDAVRTYRMNFLHTDIFLMDATSFILTMTRTGGGFYVDILHLSPPCQAFSPANTRHNVRLDDMNQGSFLAVGDLVRRIKPRLVTLEETSGLKSHHAEWLRKLVGMLTDIGYSVRWGAFKLDKFGAPQPRNRLVMYAACPGGRLPNFPLPTHGETTGLEPCTTIEDALRPLTVVDPASITHHDPDAPRRFTQREPYLGTRPLRQAITCNGGTGYHPSGRRRFTGRELALLQSFPVDFKFPQHLGVTAIQKQIGNAVPPIAFKPFLEQCVATLEREDREREQER